MAKKLGNGVNPRWTIASKCNVWKIIPLLILFKCRSYNNCKTVEKYVLMVQTDEGMPAYCCYMDVVSSMCVGCNAPFL